MKLIDKIIIRIQGLRKWSIMILLVTIAVVFRIKNLLSGVEMVDLLKATTIAFFSSNAIEHVKRLLTKKED